MCLGIPGRILEVVDEHNQIAKVDVSGVRRNVNVGLLAFEGEIVGPGDWVLIHVGFAIARIDEAEAAATLSLLEGLGEPYEQELADFEGSRVE